MVITLIFIIYYLYWMLYTAEPLAGPGVAASVAL